jgi:hypothetical protein
MRLLAPLALTAALLALATPALAAGGVDSTGTVYSTDKVVVPLVFPVLGATSYSDTFLACRSGCARKHMGQDLMGAKMSPLVAACDGSVVSQKKEAAVGGGNYLVIACDRGPAAGWSAVYIHINNDTPGTDDGKGTAGFAFPAGIAPGVRVLAGQLVGWRGDSGDAESTGAHLHFELRKGDGWGGTVYNAAPSLRAARHLSAPVQSGPHPDGTLLRAATGQRWVLIAGLKHPITPEVLVANRISPASAITVSGGELQAYANGTAVRARTGGPVRTGGQVYALSPEGRLRYVSLASLRSYGWTQADVVDLPLDAPQLELGEPLGLRDGTAVNVPGIGAGVVSGGVFHRLWNTQEINLYGYTGKPRLSVPPSEVALLPVAELAGQPEQQGYHR